MVVALALTLLSQYWYIQGQKNYKAARYHKASERSLAQQFSTREEAFKQLKMELPTLLAYRLKSMINNY